MRPFPSTHQVFSEPPRKARTSARTITDSEPLPHRPAIPFHTVHHAASLWDPAWMNASAVSRHTHAGAGGSTRSCRPPVPSPEHTVTASGAPPERATAPTLPLPHAPPSIEVVAGTTPAPPIEASSLRTTGHRPPSSTHDPLGGSCCDSRRVAPPAPFARGRGWTPRKSQPAAGTRRPTPRCSETLRASVNSETRESPLDTPGR